MKKVIFALSFIGLGLVSVSCSTDAYDLPEAEELKLQRTDEQLDFVYDDLLSTEENAPNFDAKEGDEDSANTTDNTGPSIQPPKKD